MDKAVAMLAVIPTQRNLLTAIEGGDVDEKVLHYFALDCARRAIFAEYQDGSQPAWYTQLLKKGWRLLELKQAWLEDESREAEVESQKKQVLDLSFLSLHAEHQPEPFLLRFGRPSDPLDPDERLEAFYLNAYPILAILWHAGRFGDATDLATQIALDSIRIKGLDEPMHARDDEIEWQCHRLYWWSSFAAHTHRFWLAYEAVNPLPPHPRQCSHIATLPLFLCFLPGNQRSSWRAIASGHQTPCT